MTNDELSMELADCGSPEGLAKIIHAHIPLKDDGSVNLRAIAKAVGIKEIKPSKSTAYEGLLITDASKSKGAILYNSNSNTFRKRFTVAHELGHFLLPFHNKNAECASSDMTVSDGKNTNLKKEAEATLDKPDQVTGSHNKHLQDKCVIFADEAFFAGNRQHAATLKTLVTSNEIFVHPKFVDGFMAPKRFRVIIASNDEHVIRAEEDDRRYLVLDVDAGEHNQDGEYFGAIMDEWNSGGKQALFRWLRGDYWRNKLETGEWDVRDRPQTKALQKQKEFSLPETQAIIQQMLAAGELPDLYAHDAETETVFVSTRVLAVQNRLKAKDETALGILLRVLAGPEAENVRVYLGDAHNRRQYRGYWLPSLPECRQRWENHLNRLIEWPDDVRSWGFEVKPDDIPF